MISLQIQRAIDLERHRQDAKWGWPNEGLAGLDENKKNTILGEEVGEVARAVLENDEANLEAELVQTAAVCVAWLESRCQQRWLTGGSECLL